MSEHTPGPWRIGYPDLRCREDHIHKGRPTCKYEIKGWHTENSFECYVSTLDGRQIVGSDDWGSILTPQDARLIAAAPDLLAACKQAIAAFEHGEPVNWAIVSGAIVKAEVGS